MTSEELLSVAEIVEKLTDRFNAQAALHHEAKMVEHRAAFGARTSADAKIIAGLRSEIVAARMAVLERDSLMSERDGLLTQVQDMRAEITRLTGNYDLLRREYEVASLEIKVGDVVEVVSNTGRNTWLADVGSVGTVTSIETLDDSLSVRLKDVPDKKNVCGGYVSICDVRKVTT